MPLKSFLLLSAVFLAAPVLAHNGAMGIVKERMDGMVAIGKAMKELTSLSKTAPLDQEAIAAQAEILAAHSGDRMLERFPTGSLQDVSEARASIWENWEKFSSIAYELEALAAQFPEQKSPVLMQNLLTLTGETCSACHKSFRIKK